MSSIPQLCLPAMTLDLYPPIVHQLKNLPHAGSTVDELCEEIHSATKGWGANKQKVIDALATQDATVRTQMFVRYKELYEGQDLSKLMDKEFSGNFGLALEFLALPPHYAECAMIKHACKGIGSNANIVWSIVCGRTNAEIELLKKTYFELYTKDLGKLLAKELTGNMERLVFNCLQAGEVPFDPQYHTAQLAVEEAEFIREKGQGRWGTDEKSIFKILCASPPQHLENIDKAYAEKYGYKLAKALEKELGGVGEGKVQDACVHLVGMKLKPAETAAQLIKQACAGIGTDELLLACSIIRYQTVLSAVQSAHIELFGKTIQDRVRSEVGGKFKAVLLQVLNTAWPEQG